jgi:glycosyltransferase involved in cell wall biosynthesis
MKILIALATYNRPIITELCLKNLQTVRSETTKLVVYDDCSTAYDKAYILKYSDEVTRFSSNIGIEQSRAAALREFLLKYKEFDVIYFTDNDAIHDPDFTKIIEYIVAYQETNHEKVFPFSLFNSVVHCNINNIIKETNQFLYQKTMPGISQCYTRQMAKKIVKGLNDNPGLEKQYGWDYIYPQILNLPCLLPKISYVEHFARDRFEGGMHSQNSGIGPEAFQDFERDRALNPSSYLANSRNSIINKILGITTND